MAKLILNGSTSGSVTLESPAVSGTTTLTLPTTTGTVALTASPTFTGQATIPTINLTGGQITFPATQSASSDGNTLDDYEEGTFTPSVTGVTVGTTTGIYIKIGKLVFINIIIPVTSGSNTGMTITNLPFTTWTGNRQVLIARENAVVGKTGQLYIESNSTSGSIQDYAGTSGGTNGYTWIITGSYQSA
jgi:hypothetical protein